MSEILDAARFQANLPALLRWLADEVEAGRAQFDCFDLQRHFDLENESQTWAQAGQIPERRLIDHGCIFKISGIAKYAPDHSVVTRSRTPETTMIK